MFNVAIWAEDMRNGIDSRDAERLADLMSRNDRNGCFSYVDFCNECGETSYGEWVKGTIECAIRVMEDHPNHI